MHPADRALVLVCCQHHYTTHTSRISLIFDIRLTVAVALVSRSSNETESMHGTNIVRNHVSNHGKPKVYITA